MQKDAPLFPYTTLFRSRGRLPRLVHPQDTVPEGGDTHARDLRLLAQYPRSEEHTSELQSQSNLVCRLLLEKKKTERPIASITFQIRVNSSATTPRITTE